MQYELSIIEKVIWLIDVANTDPSELEGCSEEEIVNVYNNVRSTYPSLPTIHILFIDVD